MDLHLTQHDHVIEASYRNDLREKSRKAAKSHSIRPFGLQLQIVRELQFENSEEGGENHAAHDEDWGEEHDPDVLLEGVVHPPDEAELVLEH